LRILVGDLDALVATEQTVTGTYFTIYNYYCRVSLTIDLTDESQLQLEKADITVQDGTIQFSLEGEIQNIPDHVMAEYNGESLLPTEVSFERQ
jgi:hypothetical protein